MIVMDRRLRHRLAELLIFIILVSGCLTACSGGQKESSKTERIEDKIEGDFYQDLKKPDRIHAYWGSEEKVFKPDDQVFTDIYDVVKKDWEDSKKFGLLEMVQLILLEKESAPADRSRVVFEYDKPVRWRVSPDNQAPQAQADKHACHFSAAC